MRANTHSVNPLSERKCNDHKSVGEDKLPGSNRQQLGRSDFKMPGSQGTASEEAVRRARILALQVSINEGSYRVSAGEVAGSLFRYAERHHAVGLQMYSA